MKAIDELRLQRGAEQIVYDGAIEDIQPEIWPRLFDPEFLRESGVVTATAEGRGSAYFFTWGSNRLVLRHYLRGGLLGKVISDRYLGGSLESSRPYLEWKLLGKLVELGLPAPRPAGIRLCSGAGFYRGDLLTHEIEDARPLGALLQQAQLEEKSWRAVGGTIRKFHDHGILHSDLNAANILIQDEKIFLIDFDKAELRDPGPWKNANLERLERSLKKWRRQEETFHFTTTDWQSLQEGYNAT